MDKVNKAPRLTKKRQLHMQSSSACNGGGDNVTTSNCLSKLNSSNQDREMGDAESDGEDEEFRRPSSRSSKKFKLHSKSFVGHNAVDQATVPRKLRSAMAKRSGESLSPPLSYKKKLCHTSLGMEAPRINGAKKSTLNLKQGEANRIVSGPITKEEEEVAETLFSLARIQSDKKLVDSRVDRRISDDKSSPLEGAKDSPQRASEASKESTLSQRTCSAAEVSVLSPNLESSFKQNSISGPTIMGRPIGRGNNKFELALGSSSALSNHLRTSLPSRGATADAIPLADPSELGVSPDFCNVTGSVQPVQHGISLRQQKLDYGKWQVLNSIESKEAQPPVSEHKGSGALLACIEGAPYLWPGMYRVQACGGEVHGSSRWSPSTKFPVRMDCGTPSIRIGSSETSHLIEKVKLAIVDKKQSRKRCATHVYISHLIQAYQTAEKKPRWPVPAGQVKSNESSKLGVASTDYLIDLGTIPNGVISVAGATALNGINSTASNNCSALGKGPNELQANHLKERRLQQQMSISSSGTYSSERENCDFLSLSAGGGGLEHVATTTSDNYRGGTGLMHSVQGNLTYLHPVVQNHPLMPFSQPHARTASSQVPQYTSSPIYYPSHPGQNLEQQQHQVWAAQMASQYRTGGISASHLVRWQNGMLHETPSLAPCTQPSFSTLSANKVSQQQQMFALSPPSSCSTGKREHYQLPGLLEGGGRLQSDVSPRLQLVCNAERL